MLMYPQKREKFHSEISFFGFIAVSRLEQAKFPSAKLARDQQYFSFNSMIFCSMSRTMYLWVDHRTVLAEQMVLSSYVLLQKIFGTPHY